MYIYIRYIYIYPHHFAFRIKKSYHAPITIDISSHNIGWSSSAFPRATSLRALGISAVGLGALAASPCGAALGEAPGHQPGAWGWPWAMGPWDGHGMAMGWWYIGGRMGEHRQIYGKNTGKDGKIDGTL